jgi:hypothetical protein
VPQAPSLLQGVDESVLRNALDAYHPGPPRSLKDRVKNLRDRKTPATDVDMAVAGKNHALRTAWNHGPGTRVVMHAFWREPDDWTLQRFTLTNPGNNRLILKSKVTGTVEVRPDRPSFTELWKRISPEAKVGIDTSGEPAVTQAYAALYPSEIGKWTRPDDLKSTRPGAAARMDLQMRGRGGLAVFNYEQPDLEATYGARFEPAGVWPLIERLRDHPNGPQGILRVTEDDSDRGPNGFNPRLAYRYVNVFKMLGQVFFIDFADEEFNHPTDLHSNNVAFLPTKTPDTVAVRHVPAPRDGEWLPAAGLSDALRQMDSLPVGSEVNLDTVHPKSLGFLSSIGGDSLPTGRKDRLVKSGPHTWNWHAGLDSSQHAEVHYEPRLRAIQADGKLVHDSEWHRANVVFKIMRRGAA